MSTASEKWASGLFVTIPRFQFEWVIKQLNKIEALSLIRAAYQCSLSEAQELLKVIQGR